MVSSSGVGSRSPLIRPRGLGVTLATLAAALGLSASLSGCVVDEVVAADEPTPTPLSSNETRTVELRFLRFEVQNFEQTMTIDEVRALPEETLRGLWLFNFDFTDVLITVLDELKSLPPSEADQLPQAAQNMRQLLRMTPDTADLTGTNLEEAIALAAQVSIPPQRVLADLMEVGITDEVIPPDVASRAILDNLIASHPNAQFRDGPVDAEHPDGRYPIPSGAVPVTLYDVATDFASMPVEFGPAPLDPDDPGGLVHPGFVKDAEGIVLTDPEFEMVFNVSLNALPYKGVDLTDSSIQSVNSIATQVSTMFDFESEDWMRITGLKDVMHVDALTMSIVENDAFLPGGGAMEPEGQGDSPVWELPPWEFERLIMEMARLKTLGDEVEGIGAISPHCDAYEFGTGTIAFKACVGLHPDTPVGDEPPPPETPPAVPEGWAALKSFGDIGDPPAPAYLWDVLIEVVQTRLHDGGLAEGDADVEFTLRDVDVPLDVEAMLAEIKTNFAQEPELLIDVAERFNDTSTGDPDFYYYRPRPDAPAELQGDYLYFIAPVDIRKDETGKRVRPYDYANPGFFFDQGLTDKASALTVLDGDSTHEKVKIAPGTVLYMQDDEGVRFKLEVGEKPSQSRITLDITRLD